MDITYLDILGCIFLYLGAFGISDYVAVKYKLSIIYYICLLIIGMILIYAHKHYRGKNKN